MPDPWSSTRTALKVGMQTILLAGCSATSQCPVDVLSSAWEVRVGQPRPIPIVRSRDALCPFKGWPTIDRGLFAARKSANKKQLRKPTTFPDRSSYLVTLQRIRPRDHLEGSS